MGLFRRKKDDLPDLTRDESLDARPVLNRLVKLERSEDGHAILQIPRRDSGLARLVAKVFRMSPYRQLALDEIGTFVVELCDGEHTVRQIVDKLAETYTLNRREAELSLGEFLRMLARRSLIGLVIEEK
ncbi:MAG: PqqD family protein [Candidatus Brocadiia bacterium]